MNSRDNQSYGVSGPSKRQPGASQAQKVVVACDQCLLLQIRCKFNPAEQDKCRSCTIRNSECVWTQTPKPRPPPDSSYIEYLEMRVKALEKHLKDMFPGINAKREIDTLLGPASGDSQPSLVATSPAQRGNVGSPEIVTRSTPTLAASTPGVSRLVQLARLTNTRDRLVHADANDDDTVWDATSSTRQDEPRYHGQSSSEVLSRDANIFRNGYHSDSILSAVPATYRRAEFWQPTAPEVRVLKRDPWRTEDGLALELPPDDLLRIVLDAYFDNTLFPVIHRPSFEKQLKEGLHKRDGVFLRVVLLMCANGARWCDDPRVLDDRWPVPLSAGHKWFRQFKPWHKYFVDQMSLCDAQLLVLIAMYFFGSSASYGTWTVVGTGIRMMQDIGAHRKKSCQSLENELYKRCFWSLVFFDRLQSITLGRHGAMQELDSDLDEALEVDDELWSLEPNAPPPVQPAGIPSKLSGFNQLIGLCRIAGRCLQTVFALERTKHQIGLNGPEGSAWMFNDINTQLNMWARDVPSHLQLPNPVDYATMPGFSGTVALWGVYYDLVISANRTFITKTSSPLSAPSMRLCREAARACANMIDAHRRIYGSRLLPAAYYPAFSSAMTLVVDLIAEHKIQRLQSQDGTFDASTSINYTTQQKEEDMRKCMRVLEEGEKYFHIAGRLHDIIREFEESWRLQISPNARSASSGRGSVMADSPNNGSSQMHPSPSARPLPFQPADSVLSPFPRPSNQSQSEIDSSLDIAYDPPDTTHAPDPAPGSLDPRRDDLGTLDYEYARHTAYADEMFSGLCASTTPRSTSHQPEPGVGLTASGYRPDWSRQGPENKPPFIGAMVAGLQPYMPEYGYNAVDAPHQHAQRITSRLGPEVSPASTLIDNTADLNTTPVAIPGLGVFSPRGWAPTFGGVIHAPGYTKIAGGSIDDGATLEGVIGTGSFMRAQWDAAMQNTLNINKRQFNQQHRS